MTQEIKLKLDQTCKEKYPGSRYDNALRRVHFKAGTQTILENPGEWGLVPKAQHDHYMAKYTSLVEWYDRLMGTPCEQVRHQQEIESLQAQNKRYREVLEEIEANCDNQNPTHELFWRLAKEALKQEVNNERQN